MGLMKYQNERLGAQHFYRPEYIVEHVRYKDMTENYEWGTSMNLGELEVPLSMKTKKMIWKKSILPPVQLLWNKPYALDTIE